MIRHSEQIQAPVKNSGRERINQLFDITWDRVNEDDEILFNLALCELRAWSKMFPDLYEQVFFLRTVRYLRKKHGLVEG